MSADAAPLVDVRDMVRLVGQGAFQRGRGPRHPDPRLDPALRCAAAHRRVPAQLVAGCAGGDHLLADAGEAGQRLDGVGHDRTAYAARAWTG